MNMEQEAHPATHTDAGSEAEIDSMFDSLVHEAENIILQSHDTWRLVTTKRIIHPLQESLTAAVYHHREISTNILSDENPSLLTQISVYRQVVLEQVLQPLAHKLIHLAELDAWNNSVISLKDLIQITERTTEHCTLPLSLSLYTPGIDNRRRVRKSLARWRLYLAARTRTLLRQPPKEPLRRIPLRLLFQYHAHVRIADTAIKLHEQWEQHVAGLIGKLEAAFSDWTNIVLALEHRLEGAVNFNIPPEAFLNGSPLSEDASTANTALTETLLQASKALQETLEQTEIESTLPDMDSKESFGQDTEHLREDFRLAGTVLLADSERRLGDRRKDRHMEVRKKHWFEWRMEALAKIDLCVRTVCLRGTFVSCRHALLKHIADTALAPVQYTFESASTLLNECLEPNFYDDPDVLPSILQNLHAHALEPVRNTLTKPLNLPDVDQELQNPGQHQWIALTTSIDEWPESIVLHSAPRQVTPITPNRNKLRCYLRQDLQLLLTPFHERLTPSARTLRQKLAFVWDSAEQVVSVVEFSLSAALRELEGPIDEEAVERARRLVEEGLGRTSTTLQDLRKSLDAPWHGFVNSVFIVFRQDWSNIHRSLSSVTRVEYHWLVIRFRLRRSMRQIQRQIASLAQRTAGLVDILLQRSRRRATSLIEHGRTAISTAPIADNEKLHARNTIGPAAMRALRARLPLVYHKLFDLEAVSEPWLLAGRSADIEYLHNRVAWWHQCRAGGGLVLPMPPGSGRSSLLRAFGSELEGTVHITTLAQRPKNIAEFASEIGSAIGMEVSSLDELEVRLLESSPRICLVDNLEHLMLRAYGGTELFQRALLFFARTDAHVCWIATINDHAWQYLKLAVAGSVNLVSTHQTTPVNRGMLESVVMARHQRSGIRLNFAKPAVVPPLLSRRLRTASSIEAKQTVLRNHFFDRLHLRCGSNVMLALATWLWKTKFEGGHVTAGESASPGFSFLQSLGLAHRFTLKAFLMHNTLTPLEHHRIFISTPGDTTAVLQSLLNLNVIIPCGWSLTKLDENPNKIVGGTRYRLHPLLLHPVDQLLRKENIVH